MRQNIEKYFYSIENFIRHYQNIDFNNNQYSYALEYFKLWDNYLSDVNRVHRILNKHYITEAEYNVNGKYKSNEIKKYFFGWQDVLNSAGLISKEILLNETMTLIKELRINLNQFDFDIFQKYLKYPTNCVAYYFGSFSSFKTTLKNEYDNII